MDKRLLFAVMVSSALLSASPAALAQANDTASPAVEPVTAAAPVQPPTERVLAIDPICLKAALTVHGQSLMSALDAFYAAQKLSFSTRIAAMMAAVDLTGQDRVSAVQAAEKDFQSSQKAAQEAWQKAKQAAAEKFQTDQRACGGNAAGSDKLPPQGALAACSGKAAGDSCTFANEKADINGVCREAGKSGNLVCAPNRGEGQGRENGQPAARPPQAAIDVCANKAAGDSCTFADQDKTVTGICRQTPASDKLVCAPNRAEDRVAGQREDQQQQDQNRGQGRGLGGRIMDFFRGLFGKK